MQCLIVCHLYYYFQVANLSQIQVGQFDEVSSTLYAGNSQIMSSELLLPAKAFYININVPIWNEIDLNKFPIKNVLENLSTQFPNVDLF